MGSSQVLNGLRQCSNVLLCNQLGGGAAASPSSGGTRAEVTPCRAGGYTEGRRTRSQRGRRVLPVCPCHPQTPFHSTQPVRIHPLPVPRERRGGDVQSTGTCTLRGDPSSGPSSPPRPPLPRAAEEGPGRQGQAGAQAAGLRLPWEGIACVGRAARASGQRAPARRPERGDWNVERKRVHGNSKLSPDEKQRGEGGFFGK